MTAKAPHRRTWRRTLALSILLFALVSTLSLVPLIREAELRLTDTYFRLAPPPATPSRVVLVLVDETSLRQYGRWPWSRVLLAQMTRNLAQAGAQVIGLDILLSEPQSPAADNALRDALAASKRAVLVDKIGTYPDGPRWIEPLPQFAQAAIAVGHAQAVLDVDGTCRRFPARELTTDGSRWALAVELARRTDPRQTAAFLASYGVPSTDEARIFSTASPVLVPIAFRRDRFAAISAAAALEARGLEVVRGRPVLIGFSTTEISDRLSTPLTGEFPAPGVEIHAQILDNILTGRQLHELPLGATALLLLLTCIFVVAVVRTQRGWAAVGFLIVAGAGVYAAALLLLVLASRLLPAGPVLLAMLLGPLLVYTDDFVVVERSIAQQLRALGRWLPSWRSEHMFPRKSALSWKLDLLGKLQGELGSIYELHHTLLETTRDLVAIFDNRGNLLLSNQAFATLCPPLPDAAITLPEVRSRLRPQDGEPWLAMDSGVQGEAYLGDDFYAVRIVPLPSTALAPGGGTIVTLTSLRARVERDRARGEALGFITHELRTPLVAMQGLAQVMTEYPDSPASRTAPATIFRESRRLLALINNYLDVLRLDAGARPLRSEVVRLDETVRHVFDILQPLAAAARMSLVLEGDAAPIMGDAALLSGAVLNLVSNAIKYGRPETEIRVRCSQTEGEAVVTVNNYGEAIAQEEVPRLFDAYYRASTAETSPGGWGLGLAFVKRIAEKHGGSVRVESNSAGTSFALHLPASTPAAMKGAA